jgi:hypothetical protein
MLDVSILDVLEEGLWIERVRRQDSKSLTLATKKTQLSQWLGFPTYKFGIWNKIKSFSFKTQSLTIAFAISSHYLHYRNYFSLNQCAFKTK